MSISNINNMIRSILRYIKNFSYFVLIDTTASAINGFMFSIIRMDHNSWEYSRSLLLVNTDFRTFLSVHFLFLIF